MSMLGLDDDQLPSWTLTYEFEITVRAGDMVDAQELADYDAQDLFRRRRANISEPSFGGSYRVEEPHA